MKHDHTLFGCICDLYDISASFPPCSPWWHLDKTPLLIFRPVMKNSQNNKCVKRIYSKRKWLYLLCRKVKANWDYVRIAVPLRGPPMCPLSPPVTIPFISSSSFLNISSSNCSWEAAFPSSFQNKNVYVCNVGWPHPYDKTTDFEWLGSLLHDKLMTIHQVFFSNSSDRQINHHDYMTCMGKPDRCNRPDASILESMTHWLVFVMSCH